ncbi:excisionase family DNA-binding protein [Amycolatopsis minnesotensis]|uniref:Helix-turn-helix domain-containing protein n=1 Tax=Amycolatopsis minnesotensis TaxID=337894 RepID=A0ABN2SCN8_9PSEU
MDAQLIRFPHQTDTAAPHEDAPYTGPIPTIDPCKTTYTVEQAAYLISLSVDLTREYVEDGTIPAIRTANGWEIPRARFIEWIDNLPEA